MDNTQIIGLQDFSDKNGKHVIYKQNAHLHGLVQCGNVDLTKLYGLSYYFVNNVSLLYNAITPFGRRHYSRHTNLNFVKNNLYFKKEDLLLRGLSILENNLVTTRIVKSKQATRRTAPVLEDEQFDFKTNDDLFIRTFNANKYGLVKVIGKKASKLIGLRYFYLQSQGNTLKRSTSTFILRLGCENTVYYFYKKDIEAREMDLQNIDLKREMRESCNKIVLDLPPTLPAPTPPPVTPVPTVTNTSDKLLQLFIELQEAEKKVLDIKHLIKDTLGI
jgi:hypothetical protein